MNYKFSKYNNFVDYNNEIICFNSMSGALFTISKNQYRLFNKYKNNLQKLNEYKKDLYETLIKTRFIIPENQNELDIIKFRNRRDVFINNFYKLIINPTLDCNFKCWYCYESHPKGRMTEEMMERVKKYVESLIEAHKISGLNLSWFGGEPLLCFNNVIYPLSKKLKQIIDNNKIIYFATITTNGYLLNENMLEKINEIGLRSFQITLDGNEERHNKNRNINGKPTFRKIVDNINMLCEKLKDSYISLRINYKDETLEDIEEIINNFPKKNRDKIKIDFQRIWQTFDKGISLNEKLREKINLCQDNGFNTSSAHFELHKGFVCYADRWHGAVINYDGNVYKCTARDFTKENSCGYLKEDGTIKWKPEKIFKRFAKATFENKMCLNCKLLPMCLGPCSQKMVETKEEDLVKICHLKLIEVSVEDFIINRYKQLLRAKEKENIRNNQSLNKSDEN